MIQAVIYDMDGVLINSEPLWQQTEIRIFQEVGVPMTLEKAHETMGMRTNEVVAYWHNRFPWEAPSLEAVEVNIWNQIVELVQQEGVAMAGVYESLDFFKNKGIKIGLASASSMRLINAVLDKLKLRDYFEVVHSAEFEEYGKPHPGVYISAAKSAKMQVIAIPDVLIREDKRIHIADYRLDSLLGIDEVFWKTLNT